MFSRKAGKLRGTRSLCPLTPKMKHARVLAGRASSIAPSSIIGSSLADRTTNPQETCCADFSDYFRCKHPAASRHRRTMIDARVAASSPRLSPAQEELSALPIWTLTLGIFSLLTFGLTAVASIVCGHLALARTRGRSEASFEKWVTTVGLVTGYLGAAVFGTWVAVLVGLFVSY